MISVVRRALYAAKASSLVYFAKHAFISRFACRHLKTTIRPLLLEHSTKADTFSVQDARASPLSS